MRFLILVDIQNDFMEDGPLEVPHANEIIPIVNKLIPKFDYVIATQDWHPETHGSFATNHGLPVGNTVMLNGLEQKLWPVHCVQATFGAELSWQITEYVPYRFQKGTDPLIDSYSGFFDNHKNTTGLGEFIQSKCVWEQYKNDGCSDVYVCGLATDYCVKATALDALYFKFDSVNLILDACRGISTVDSRKAIEEMWANGVKIIHSENA